MEKSVIVLEDYVNCNINSKSFLESIKKFQLAVEHGYLSYDNLVAYEPEVCRLHEQIVQAKEKILSDKRITLCLLIPAFDHLRLFLTAESVGSISLVCKEINEAMVCKYGFADTKASIIKYRLSTKDNKRTIGVKVPYLNQIFTVPIVYDITLKKQLRILLGCERYFRDDNNHELFFISDLEYVLKMANNKKISMELCFPKKICVICKKMKSVGDTHDECFDLYVQNNCPKYYDDHYHPIYFSRNFKHANRTDYILKCLGPSRDCHRLYRCEYIYPELISCFDTSQNLFPVPRTKKSEIVLCAGGTYCENCIYYTCNNGGEPRTAHYSGPYHKRTWNYFQNNIIPPRIKKKCRGVYKIPIDCITNKISYMTPCDLCNYPRFFHNIDFSQ